MTQCAAHSKETGEQCKRQAHPGTTVCVKHGAGSPRVRVVAAQKDLILKYGENFPIDRSQGPAEVILQLISAKSAELEIWRSRVEQLQADELTWSKTREKIGGEDYGVTYEQRLHEDVAVMHRVEKQLFEITERALKAGIAAAQIELQRNQITRIVQALRMFVEDDRITTVDGWTKEQIMREHLLTLSGGSDDL